MPKLATSWVSADGGKRWTFTLRSACHFSDGTPLTPRSSRPRSTGSSTRRTSPPLCRPSSHPRHWRGDHRDAGRSSSRCSGLSPTSPTSSPPATTTPLSSSPTTPATSPRAASAPARSCCSPTSHQGRDADAQREVLDIRQALSRRREIHFYADEQARPSRFRAATSMCRSSASRRSPSHSPTGGISPSTRAKGTGVTVLTLRVDQAPFDKKEVRQAVAYGLARPDVLQPTAASATSATITCSRRCSRPRRRTSPARRDAAEGDRAAGDGRGRQLAFTLTYRSAAARTTRSPSRTSSSRSGSRSHSISVVGGLLRRRPGKDTPWLFTQANLVSWAGRPCRVSSSSRW